VAGTLLQTGGLENRKTHWYEAVSSALNFPFLKDVSQNCFLFDVFNLKNEEVSQNCFVLTLLSSKTEEVSQNCFVFVLSTLKNEEVSQNSFVFDVVKFKHRGSLAELLHF